MKRKDKTKTTLLHRRNCRSDNCHLCYLLQKMDAYIQDIGEDETFETVHYENCRLISCYACKSYEVYEILALKMGISLEVDQ